MSSPKNKNTTSDRIHGNSLLSTNPNHVYVIVDQDTGKLIKVGISGQPLNSDGSSPRANSQLPTISKKYNIKARAVVIKQNLSRKEALNLEQKITDRHGSRNKGEQPSDEHKLPKADVRTPEEYYYKYRERNNRHDPNNKKKNN